MCISPSEWIYPFWVTFLDFGVPFVPMETWWSRVWFFVGGWVAIPGHFTTFTLAHYYRTNAARRYLGCPQNCSQKNRCDQP